MNNDGLTLNQLAERNAVLVSEVEKLRAERDRLAADNSGLKEQMRALAADNSALINSSVCTLQDGRPLHGFYASEWFIARLKNGEYAALKALPEEYSYDYRTNDGTYYTKDWVVGWMQTPDTEYRPNVKTPETDAAIAGIKAEALPANIAEIIDSGDLETICYESERSYAEDFRLAFYNFRQLRKGGGAK